MIGRERLPSCKHNRYTQFQLIPAGCTELKAKRGSARDILNDKYNNLPERYGYERNRLS
jgi:hypothetical protein